MREYCLVNKAGKVINMSMCYGDREPYTDTYMIEQGLQWLPIGKISQAALRRYRYWNERP